MKVSWLIIAATAACLAVSFLLSGIEAGVFAISRLRVRQLMRSGNARARLLHGYLEDPENFLWTILIGNTLANFVAVAVGVMALHQWLGSWQILFWLAFLVGIFWFYTLFELLPKMLFRRFPNRLCLLLVGAFRWIHVGLSPLVAVFEWSSDRWLRWTGGQEYKGHLFGNCEELRRLMQESGQGFTTEERSMINRVLDFQRLTVGQIAIPWSRATTVQTQSSMGEVMALCRDRKLTRLPVWQKSGQRSRIAGVVSLKTLMYQAEVDPRKKAGDYMRPALYLKSDLRLEEALRRMQRSGQRLAIVLGPDQSEIGIISLQDSLRYIFGEVSL